jgi:thiamine phosphate synthase YjbQ (UPF0047 family)
MFYVSTPRAASSDPKYRHGEGNSDAYIKASLMGSSVPVPLRDSSLVLARGRRSTS